jgi:hypothetical protein
MVRPPMVRPLSGDAMAYYCIYMLDDPVGCASASPSHAGQSAGSRITGIRSCSTAPSRSMGFGVLLGTVRLVRYLAGVVRWLIPLCTCVLLADELALLPAAEVAITLKIIDTRSSVHPDQDIPGTGHPDRRGVSWGLAPCRTRQQKTAYP